MSLVIVLSLHCWMVMMCKSDLHGRLLIVTAFYASTLFDVCSVLYVLPPNPFPICLSAFTCASKLGEGGSLAIVIRGGSSAPLL